MNKTATRTFSFADYEVDAIKRRLTKNGQTLSLNPKAFDLLLALIENYGQIVQKEELLDKVWTNQFVEENNLTVHISALRKLFGEKKGEHQFIITIPGRGYKFVADVRLPAGETLLLPPENSNNKVAANNERDALTAAAPGEFGGGPLIGREREIAEIKNLLRRGGAKLVTLTGAGGTGKTSLARTIGEELTTDFADGVFFIELAAVSDAKTVAPAIAQKLGVRESSGVSLVESLVNFLRERQTLLVLDNFEQLISAAPLLGELLKAALSLKILVTSRVALRLDIEQESVVTPLAVPPRDSVFSAAELTQFASVNLFVARARNARQNFTLTEENSAAVAEICHKLDGLPLAIELAAARVKLLSPQAILERLANSLKLLTGGAKDLSPRQRTMRGAIEWSYALLEPEEKVLFRHLAVFAGGFTIEAAEAVCEKAEPTDLYDSTILDLITSLVEKNLLVYSEQSDGNARLRMLEVVRDFASENLKASGELEELQLNHARFFLALAEKAEPNLSGERGREWLENLETEIDNLRAALGWSAENEAETLIRLAAAIREFWASHSHLTEGCDWLKVALERGGGNISADIRFKLLYGLGFMARQRGDYETSRKAHEEGLQAAEITGDKRQIAWSNRGLGAVAYRQGDFAAALQFINKSLTISRELDDRPGIANSLNFLADLLQIDGEIGEARRLLEESLAILKQLGIKQSVSSSLHNLGSVAYRQGDFAAAEAYFTEGLATARELGQKTLIIYFLDDFGALAAGQGEMKYAAQLAGAAENLRESIGYELEPAECRFRAAYTGAVRAALDEKTYAAAFEQGREMSPGDAVALARRQPPEKSEGFPNADGQNAEIIIEKHSFSRILIEEE